MLVSHAFSKLTAIFSFYLLFNSAYRYKDLPVSTFLPTKFGILVFKNKFRIFVEVIF